MLQANTTDVRCPVESVSLLYLNPPYDWESGQSGNQRLEFVFLEHTYRWLKADGILVFVIPQARLKPCARLLADHLKICAFTGLLRPNVCVSSKSRFWRPGESGQNGREIRSCLKYSAIWKGLPSKKNCPYLAILLRYAIRFRNPAPQFYPTLAFPSTKLRTCFCDLRPTARQDAY